jgi:hypothetical protein
MRTKLLMLPVLGAALLAISAGAACAMPSLGGPTGIVSVPSATIAPIDQWQTAVSWRSFETLGMYEDARDWSFQFLKGVADDAEIWAAYRRITDGEDTNLWQLGGKYQVSSALLPRGGGLAGADISIGASLGRWADSIAMYADHGITDIDVLKAYIVATRQVWPFTAATEWEVAASTRIIGSAGLLYMRLEPDVGGDDTVVRPFVGIEIVGPSGLTGGIEYRAKDSDVDHKAVFSAFLRRQLGPVSNIEIGTTNATPIGTGLEDQSFFIRLGYDVPLLIGGY